MKIIVNKSNLTFLLLVVVGLFISFIGVFVLPDRFFFDTKVIVSDYNSQKGFIGSYPFTIWFYNITRLRTLHFSLIGVIQYLVIIFLTYKIGVPKKLHILSIKNFLIYLCFVLLGIFLSMPTKEFINIIYFSIIIFVFQTKINFQKKIICSILLLLLFSLFFRQYFILVALLTVSIFLINKINFQNKKLSVFTLGIFISILISLSYGSVKGQFMSQSSREAVNDFRKGHEGTNSMIISPVDTSKWYGEAFGIVYGFFSVNLPINGFKHVLKPQILIFIIWQILLFWILIKKYDKVLKKGTHDNIELWMFNMLFSYFIIQGVFEPDLGSAIRHKIGVFPLIYIVLYYDSFRKKIQ